MADKPFFGLRVYYSGSIRGTPEPDPVLPWKLVSFMQEGGAEVPSEHVAARNPEEMRQLRIKNAGIERVDCPEPWVGAREADIEWVDSATHMVALVNGPSHGVGMEIQRALDKPAMGLNFTPILCLVREDILQADRVTWMLLGVREPGFYLRTYTDEESAKRWVYLFLTGKIAG